MLRFCAITPLSNLRSRALRRATTSSLLGSFSSSTSSTFFVSSSLVVSSKKGFHSLALEQAMRITTPSVKHPATGTPTENEEPMTLWREHWDVEFERPYYHNLVTNEVRTTLPEGFPTRFLFYYQQKHGGVKHEASDAGLPPRHTTRAKSVKEQIKDYGIAGVTLYLVIHFGWLSVIFFIMVAGVDVTGILKSMGIDAHRAQGKSLWALWLAAVLTNKIFVPLQLLLTMALAPRCVPLVRRVLTSVGVKP